MGRKAEERIQKTVESNLRRDLAVSIQPPADSPKEFTTRQKLGRYWTSTPVWGAITMLAALLVSKVSIALVYLLVGAALVAEFVRVRFFTRWRIAGNCAGAVVIGAALFVVWKISPKPKEPPTLDQEISALAKSFPGLKNPPTSVVVTSSEPTVIPTGPKLQFSETEKQMLIIDNKEGDTDALDFKINGIHYCLEPNAFVNAHAKIASRNIVGGDLNFQHFDVNKGTVKRIDLSKDRYGFILQHFPCLTINGNAVEDFDSEVHYFLLRITFVQKNTQETFAHYMVVSPYTNELDLAQHPERGASSQKGEGGEGFPYSITRVLKEDARVYFGTEHHEYQPQESAEKPNTVKARTVAERSLRRVLQPSVGTPARRVPYPSRFLRRVGGSLTALWGRWHLTPAGDTQIVAYLPNHELCKDYSVNITCLCLSCHKNP